MDWRVGKSTFREAMRRQASWMGWSIGTHRRYRRVLESRKQISRTCLRISVVRARLIARRSRNTHAIVDRVFS